MEFDFKVWLNQFEDDDYKEVCQLFSAVKDVTEYGFFKCSRQGEAFIIQYSGAKDYSLRLGSEEARQYFLGYMEEKFAGEMGMDGWCAFKESMDRND